MTSWLKSRIIPKDIMENYKEELKRWNAVEVGWEEPLLQYQKLFKKFQDKFHEYFELPLFNGEFKEGED